MHCNQKVVILTISSPLVTPENVVMTTSGASCDEKGRHCDDIFVSAIDGLILLYARQITSTNRPYSYLYYVGLALEGLDCVKDTQLKVLVATSLNFFYVTGQLTEKFLLMSWGLDY